MAYSLGPVKAHVRAAADEIGPKFGIKTIGGFATSGHVTGSLHYLGRALDFVINNIPNGKEVGDQLAAYAWENRQRLGVTQVIYNHRIITTDRAGEGWRPLTETGVGDSGHTKHVHVSFNATGGSGGSSIVEVGNPIGDAAKAVVPGYAFLTDLGDFFAKKHGARRIVFVVVGVGLVYLGINITFGAGVEAATKLGGGPAKAVVKAVT